MIKVYTTRTCGFCHAVKNYLDSKNVEYDEVKVDEKPDAAQILLDKSGQLGVPVVDFGDEIVIGFNRPQIDLLLREKKLV